MENKEELSKQQKWRLILGKDAESEVDKTPLNSVQTAIDNTLESLYGESSKSGMGGSAPKVNRWLGDIRTYFNNDVVQIMQKDAMERLGLKQMLLEPELLQSVEPDVHLVGTLLSLNKVIPEKTKSTARFVVKKVVSKLIEKIQNPLREAVMGAINKSVRNRKPRYNEIDWNRTIRINLKHYQKDYQTIIPQQLRGFGKKGQALRDIILLVDQSGSMASSVVYSSVYAAVLASLPSVRTKIVFFDTAVVDMSDKLKDPVELLFGAQLGGGTDIGKVLSYAEKIISMPSETILILITDLIEGANVKYMLKQAAKIKNSGVHFITLLALSDEGSAIYDKNNANSMATLGIPAFACTPNMFPDLMASAIKKEDLNIFMNRHGLFAK